jgi:hypothetical protein
MDWGNATCLEESPSSLVRRREFNMTLCINRPRVLALAAGVIACPSMWAQTNVTYGKITAVKPVTVEDARACRSVEGALLFML